MKKLCLFIIAATLFAITANAESPRKIFTETYTSAYCGWCAVFAPSYTAFGENNESWVVPVNIHTGNGPGDPMYQHNSKNSWRVGKYVSGSYGTPAVWVNGEKVDWDKYGNKMEELMNQMSPITLGLSELRAEGSSEVTVNIQSDDAFNNVELTVMIVEEYLHFDNAGSNGEKEFHWTVRNILPQPHQGKAIQIGAGSDAEHKFSFQHHPDWNMKNIYVVALIQDLNTKEVYQSERTFAPTNALPEATLSMNSIEFGNVADEKTESIEITNTGTGALKITGLAIDGNNDVFSIAGQKSFTIEPNASREIEVRFFPLDNIQYNDKIVVTSNLESALEIPLAGKGDNIEFIPMPSLVKNQLNFPDTEESEVRSIEIENKGKGDLEITGYRIENDEYKVFIIEDMPGDAINPLRSGEIEVKFRPVTDHDFKADLYIETNSDEELKVTLRGTGSNVTPFAYVSAMEDEIAFGETGETTYEVTLKNLGFADLEISEVKIRNNTYGVFSIAEEPAVKTLANGEETTLKIGFKPTEEKEYLAKLRVESNSIDGDYDVSISATGTFSSIDEYRSANGLLSLNISPNPASGIVEVTLDNNSGIAHAVEYKLFDAMGNEYDIANSTVNSSNTFELNAGNFTPGVYRLVAFTANGAVSCPVVVVK